MANTSDIIVYYSAVDGYRTSKRFTDLSKAQHWAEDMVGKSPTFGSSYAVSDDGIGKIEVAGASLRDLFPAGG